MIKFFAGLAALALALFIQIQLAAVGLHFNLALAALIAIALIFDFWEVIILDLLTIFLLNWQPTPGKEFIIFFLVPIGALVSKKIVTWEPWIHSLITLFAGFLVFDLASAPRTFLGNIFYFAPDIVIGIIVGEIIFFALA